MAIWKLLRGIHNDSSAQLVKARAVNEKAVKVERVKDTFYSGDIFKSDKDLNRLNMGGTRRFELLPHFDASQADKTDSLDTLTIPQLREMAENEEIDLGDVSKKSEIIEVIRLQSQTETAGV